MKFPSPATYLLFLLCAVYVFPQHQPLTTFPAGVYVTNAQSIAESTKDSENFKMLMEAVKAANLEEALDKSGPFTVFAPSDGAFFRLDNAELDKLDYLTDESVLSSLLKYHIVAGRLTASKILQAMCRGEGTATFTTIHGEKIRASMNGIDIVLTDSNGNSATITTADSSYRNGVVHEIDSVIMPSRF
ncbi:MAG: fasciclin domain-containing protein [Allomuricauda sp.]|nr:MAG: fasciclin domain-containing protein [Allomuricauda sp.]